MEQHITECGSLEQWGVVMFAKISIQLTKNGA
jgi:hypothetical protein